MAFGSPRPPHRLPAPAGTCVPETLSRRSSTAFCSCFATAEAAETAAPLSRRAHADEEISHVDLWDDFAAALDAEPGLARLEGPQMRHRLDLGGGSSTRSRPASRMRSVAPRFLSPPARQGTSWIDAMIGS